MISQKNLKNTLRFNLDFFFLEVYILLPLLRVVSHQTARLFADSWPLSKPKLATQKNTWTQNINFS